MGKINPKHQIPVLSIDENTNLTESVVISQYLCRSGGHWGRAIYPTDDVLKTSRIDEAIADAKNMKFLHFAMTAIMGLPETAEGLKECEDSMQALNDLRFKDGNTWMVGDKMTLADLVLATLLSFPVYAKYPMAEKFPNLIKGFNEIQKMPEWQKVNSVMMDFIAAMKAKKTAQ